MIKRSSSSLQRKWLLIVQDIVFFICFSLLIRNKPVLAQEKPNPLYQTNQFNTSAVFRQDLCEQYDAVDSGRVPLERALEGVSLRTVSAISQYFSLNEETGAIDEGYPGLTAVLLDEFCRRAGCTWRDSFAVVESPMEGRTWSELLYWTIETYDISVDWWATSIERLAAGIAFPESWYDASIILVGKKFDPLDTKFDMWAWLDPFDRDVWLLILASLLGSGIVYMFLEYSHENTDKSIRDGSLIETTYLVAVAFTTHFEFRPTTNAARLFTFSVSFWALLVSAAYTANLASFLVVRNQRAVPINSVEDAVRANIPLCVLATTQADTAVSEAFPTLDLIRKDDMKDVFLGIHKGECAFAITTVSSWEFYQLDEDVNGHCDLEWVGRAFQFVPAGFATTPDAGKLCTSLVRDVLNIYMLRMKADGFIKSAWDTHLLRLSTWNCNWGMSTSSEEENMAGQLTLQNMGGVFIFHFILTALSVLVAVGAKFGKNDKKEHDMVEGNMNRSIDDSEDLLLTDESDKDQNLSGFPTDKEQDLTQVKAGREAPRIIRGNRTSSLIVQSGRNSISLPMEDSNLGAPRNRTGALLAQSMRSIGHGIAIGMPRKKNSRRLHDDDDSSCSSSSSSSSHSEDSLRTRLYNEKKRRIKIKRKLKKLMKLVDGESED